MVKQQPTQKKALSQPTLINQPAAYLQTRPFTANDLEGTSHNDKQATPDIQLQVQHNQGFHHNFGNIRVQPVTKTIIQPKLTIGKSGDKYEQETDKVALEVVPHIHVSQTSDQKQSIQRQVFKPGEKGAVSAPDEAGKIAKAILGKTTTHPSTNKFLLGSTKYQGGKAFKNKQMPDGTLLPTDKGQTYQEYDIHPLTKAGRGAERIVIGSDGVVYYTNDHYDNFTVIP
jgi:guanyl-specific ribonuclease Sa